MRRLVIAFILATLISGFSLADTLYLRDGSVLQGTFLGYEDGQFTFRISSSGRILRFPARDVVRLVIDRQSGDERDYPSSPARGGFEAFPAFDVELKDQWVKSDIEVQRGQRVRVEASGQIYLEGRTRSTPEGLNRRDPDAPLPNDPDGALIAAIGSDPDSPAFFIGRSREFTADRDGILYFTVNHWETREARGSYRVTVSVERRSGTAPTQPMRERTFTIYADRDWTETGIEVEPGMSFEITASGTISIDRYRRVGATGDSSTRSSSSRLPLPGAGAGALIAKIRYRNGRDSNIVLVGSSNTLTAEPGEYGRLWLGINDDNFRDNSGYFAVKIRW